MPEEQVSVLMSLREQGSQRVRGLLGSIRDALLGAGRDATLASAQGVAGAQRWGNQLDVLRGKVRSLQAALSPVTGRAGSFLAGYFSFSVIQRSLAAAREAAQASQQLSVALEGNEALIERINKLTSDLQKTTTQEDDSLKALAASMINFGLGTKDIEEGLKLAVDVAAKFNISVQQAGREVSFLYQGIVMRTLGRYIPELKKLQKEGKAATEGVELLKKATEGRAEALAKTPFGRQIQETNLLGDQYERLGEIFIKIQVRILPALTKAMELLADQLDSPSGKAFIIFLEKAVTILANLLPWIVKSYVAFRVFGVTVWALRTAFLALSAAWTAFLFLFGTPLGAAILAIGAMLTVFARLSGAWDILGKALGEIFGNLKLVWDQFSKGEIDAQTAMKKVTAIFRAGWEQIKGEFFEQFGPTWKDVWNGLVDTAKVGMAKILVDLSRESGLSKLFLKQVLGVDLTDEAVEAASSLAKIGLDTAASRPPSPQARQAGVRARKQAAEILRAAGIDPGSLAQGKTPEQAEEKPGGTPTKSAVGLDEEAEEQLRKELEIRRLRASSELVDQARAARLELELKQHKEIEGLIAKQANEELMMLATQTQRVEKVAAERDAVFANLDAAKRRLEEERQANAALVQAQQIGIFEASRRNRAALEEYRERVEEIAKEVQELLIGGELGEAIERKIVRRLDAARREGQKTAKELLETATGPFEVILTRFMDAFPQLTNAVNASLAGIAVGLNSLQGPLTQFFMAIYDGTKSSSEAFKEMLKSWAQNIAQFFAQEASRALLTFILQAAIAGVGGAAGGGAAGGNYFTPPPRNAGGPLLGRRGANRDSALFAGTVGEYVIQRPAVDYYSPQVIAAVNAMVVPRDVLRAWTRRGSSGMSLNAGGQVGRGAATPVAPTAQPAFVVANEQNMDRLLAGGGPALLRWMRTNGDQVRAQIGAV